MPVPEDLLTQLQDPAYLHVLLNHIPVIGLLAGTLALIFALLLRQRAAQIPALLVIFLAAASIYPVVLTGEAAYRPIRTIADDSGADWLDEHMDRADRYSGAYYGLAAVALIALVIPIRWPSTSTPLGIITLLAALTCLAAGIFIAEAGGRIRHPEFRPTIVETALPLPGEDEL